MILISLANDKRPLRNCPPQSVRRLSETQYYTQTHNKQFTEQTQNKQNSNYLSGSSIMLSAIGDSNRSFATGGSLRSSSTTDTDHASFRLLGNGRRNRSSRRKNNLFFVAVITVRKPSSASVGNIIRFLLSDGRIRSLRKPQLVTVIASGVVAAFFTALTENEKRIASQRRLTSRLLNVLLRCFRKARRSKLFLK